MSTKITTPDDLSNIFQATGLKKVYNLGDMSSADAASALESLPISKQRQTAQTDTSSLSVGNSAVLEDGVHMTVAQRLRTIADVAEDNVHADMAQTLWATADAEEDNVPAGMAKRLRETVDKKSRPTSHPKVPSNVKCI
jgi:hypothetical protein